jgi:hypothetical protein
MPLAHHAKAVWASAILLLALVPAVSGLARGNPLPGVRVSELLIVVVGLGVLATMRGPRMDRVDYAAFAYCGATLLLGALDLLGLRAGWVTFDGVQTLGGPLLFLLLYRACRVGLTADRDVRIVLRVVLLSAIPVGVWAVAQALDLGPARSWAVTWAGDDQFSALEDLGLGRATGPFGHPHTLGAYLVVITLVAIALFLRSGQQVLHTRWLLVILACCAGGFAASATAAPAIAALAGTVWLGIRAGQGRRVLVAALAVTVVAALAAAPLIADRVQQQFDPAFDGAQSTSVVPQTIRHRADVWWHDYRPALRGHWLSGWGPGTPAGVAYPFTESLYVTLLVRGGVLLLLVYGGFVWFVVAALRARSGSDPPERGAVAEALAVATVLFVPLHLLEPYFVTTGMPHLWWALLGLAMAEIRELR